MDRTFTIVVIALFIFAGAATAQIPTKGNIFFGYSYLSADQNSGSHANLNGWNGSLEGKIFPYVGIVADFSGHYGTENFPSACTGLPDCFITSENAALHNVLFGPRLSVPVGKFTPFAEAFFGVSHIHGSGSGFSDSRTSFSDALGGGVDYRIIHGIGFRAEGDLLQTHFFSTTQNDFRLSTGLVLHF
ncbi:MAG: outer membrane beta-barrel protein [Terriglobales bacterium]